MSDVPPNQRPPAGGHQPSPGGYEPAGGYGPPATPAGRPPGRALTIIAFVLAGVALLFFPPLFALAGVILSVIAMSKGDPLARWSLVASIAGGVLGMVIGFAVLSATN